MEERRFVDLRCPLCIAEGETVPMRVETTHAWVPSVKGIKVVAQQHPEFERLLERRDGRERSRLVCGPHGLRLRSAGIWTSQLSVLERKRQRAQVTIAEMLASKPIER